MITDLNDPRLLEEKPVPLNWLEMYWILQLLQLKARQTDATDLKELYATVALKVETVMKEHPLQRTKS